MRFALNASSISRLPQVTCESPSNETAAGKRQPGLPDYRIDEIVQHKTVSTGVWVTFGEGVYDITEFMVGHPGGDKITLAAGGALEPFWELYGVHKTSHVFEILETLRIGNIHPDDAAKQALHRSANPNDPYAHEPERHPALFVHVQKPFDAETPAQLLADQFITPTELFYVRNHLPTPKAVVDLKEAAAKKPSVVDNERVELSGIGLRRPVSMSVGELRRKLPIRTVTSAMPCAGNRRVDMKGEQPVRGLMWGVGGVGNARWTGVLLRDFLLMAGATEDGVNHIIFQGQDSDHEGHPYEASIPAAVAFDPNREVLLAFEMNGKELPIDHGFPIRVIVPGSIGARQVKWLKRIILSEEESKSFWQQKDYKTVNPSTNWDTCDLTCIMPIQDFPVQSAICTPTDGATIEGDEVTARGYAMSGGGRGILRVDVSVDGGKTWHGAKLFGDEQKYGREFAWKIWEVTIPLPKGSSGKQVEVVVKATDTSHNTQPESDVGIWNIRGLLENRWHRVKVNVVGDD